MGVERAVTRWYLQRQTILQEIATLETALHNIESQQMEASAKKTQQPAEEKMQRLAEAREKLRALGACPRPMMG